MWLPVRQHRSAEHPLASLEAATGAQSPLTESSIIKEGPAPQQKQKQKQKMLLSRFLNFFLKSPCSTRSLGSARMDRNKLKIGSGGVQIERAYVDTFSAV
jgi:hypothetical protein